MTLSRRSFAQLIGGAAAAAAMPRILGAAAPDSLATGWVRLSNNENPYGPSAAALNAIRDAFPIACRYPDAVLDDLVAAIAALHRVSPDHVLLGAGSGQLLKLSAIAFTSGTRALVTAHPTFEALGHHASVHGAEVRPIPLTKAYGHDLAKMLDASAGAGLVYICNPNNPTATITPDEEIRRFIGAVPSTTTVLVDEAYHHYVSSPAYASVIDLVAKYPNLIVLRTFSKIFGMAGMRCGYAIGQPGTLRAMRVDQGWDPVSALSLAAARASLADNRHVADQKRINTETRGWTVAELTRLGFTVLPSEANFIMVNMGQDVRPLIAAMRTRGVEVGRLFPALSEHMRVTIGKPDEMRRFMAELKTVLDSAVRAA
jgi:histidinol-phosphate aminotransferase